MNVHQNDYDEAVQGDTTMLRDIADEVKMKKPVFSNDQAETFNQKVSAGMDEEGNHQLIDGFGDDGLDILSKCSPNFPATDGNKIILPAYYQNMISATS